MSVGSRGVSGKHWCGTVNNYCEEDESMLLSLVDTGVASYIVVGREVGDSGTPHLQVFVQLVKQTRGTAVSKLTRTLGYWQLMYSTSIAASEYCKKDKSFREAGLLASGQGARTDLKSAIEMHATK